MCYSTARVFANNKYIPVNCIVNLVIVFDWHGAECYYLAAESIHCTNLCHPKKNVFFVLVNM